MSAQRAFLPCLVALLLATPLSTASAFAHCDTVDGPVVAAARKALETADATPVLRWVRASDEPEILEAFRQALEVRTKGAAAAALADRWFFETVIRVHRTGEGAPYTGLRPAGSAVDPAIRLADQALETGDVEAIIGAMKAHLEDGIRSRFARARRAASRAGESVAAGREAVAAYVDFVHFAERVHGALVGTTEPDGSEGAGTGHRH